MGDVSVYIVRDKFAVSGNVSSSLFVEISSAEAVQTVVSVSVTSLGVIARRFPNGLGDVAVVQRFSDVCGIGVADVEGKKIIVRSRGYGAFSGNQYHWSIDIRKPSPYVVIVPHFLPAVCGIGLGSAYFL